MTIIIRAPTPEEFAEAAKLVGTWFQVSRRYRMIARLPEGMTPKDALRAAMRKHADGPPRDLLPHEEARITDTPDDIAAGQFLCIYSGYYEELHGTLSVVMFKAFRAVGGGFYRARARAHAA